MKVCPYTFKSHNKHTHISTMPFSLHSRRRRIIGGTCGDEKSIDEVGTR
jgi:hypothetical protein